MSFGNTLLVGKGRDSSFENDSETGLAMERYGLKMERVKSNLIYQIIRATSKYLFVCLHGVNSFMFAFIGLFEMAFQ